MTKFFETCFVKLNSCLVNDSHKYLCQLKIIIMPNQLRELFAEAREISGKPNAPDKEIRSFIYRAMYTFLTVSKVIFWFYSLT